MFDLTNDCPPLVSDAVMIYCEWRRLQSFYELAEGSDRNTSELDLLEARLLAKAATLRRTSDFDRTMLEVIRFECGDSDLLYETYLKLRRLADDYIEAVANEIDGISARKVGNWTYFVTKWDNIAFLG